MAKEIKVPQIGDGVESATVSEILVAEGDKIEKDQGVIAVESDKASVEVPSSAAGTIKEIKISEGDEVEVGQVIILLEAADDDEDEADDKGGSSDEQEEEKTSEENEDTEEDDEDEAEEKDSDKKKKKVKEKKANDREEDSEEDGEDEKKSSKKDESEESDEKSSEESEDETSKKSSGKSTESGIQASPGTRRLARELGVDLSELAEEISGRISEKDVKEFSKKGSQKSTKSASVSLPDFEKWGSVERKPLNNIRKATAKNVTASWQSVPHVFQFDEADITDIQQYLEANQDKAEKAGGKLTITTLLTKIVASALVRFPKFNASVDMENEEMILKNYVNIGIAVATEKGLLVPVIKDADKKSIIEIAVELSNIAEKARDGKLSKEDMGGANFSISNLGGIGGTNFTPIVPAPQSAILGISRSAKKPVYIDDEFKPREILPLSLSYDHRLIDGADGAAFINWITQALQDPYKALLGA
ncbi:2-oxo acid dehydrogenase subunit E2 [Zunongwangia atlantica]|uniref:Dihydrolipoamide acetyltransferase component of pyruvate dehydrogenase complex n=1 Tax=Zunongwangia atlantica 22II14-10F7 TaxID=1185767 RepID=A0A1Y1T0N6_9FLAO|nr:2-oxo acid dehydrogenase subunit E2 [Zunongwangia atlantica]ORL44580.1 dihydrolipoyllysine-residue acetyltransferase component of pyruvate dehydrogenase complex [Zunongwangia atlantica 22II14-10F7]